MFPRVYDSVELFLLFSIVRWLVLDSRLRHLCVTITIYVFVLSRAVYDSSFHGIIEVVNRSCHLLK